MRQQTTDGQRMTLTHVVKPEASSDMASLSVEKKNEKTLNVSYAQSTGKFVEYDSNKQTFGGLTAQELIGGELEKYDYNYLGEKTLDGAKAYDVECKLKPDQDSTIARSTTLFREDNKLPAEIHMFNSKGEEIRTVHVTEFRTIEGHPTVWKTEIDNPGRKAKITIEVLNVTYPAKIDDKLFGRDNLKRLVAK
jgi:outer membrane lipoprotein-sorting protein